MVVFTSPFYDQGIKTYYTIETILFLYIWAEVVLFIKWFRSDNLQTRKGLEYVFMISIVGRTILEVGTLIAARSIFGESFKSYNAKAHKKAGEFYLTNDLEHNDIS